MTTMTAKQTKNEVVTSMNLQQDIMFISLDMGLPRQTRKVNAQADIDANRLRASAKLYSGEAFDNIKSFDAETRNMLLGLAIQIPACFRGSYVLPYNMIDQATTLLNQRFSERRDLIENFIATDYERECEAARLALRDSFREGDFPRPDVLRRYFVMEWSIFQMTVPDSLPGDVYEQERAKFQTQLNDVFVQCRAALRESLADLVAHLADRLAPDPDGSRKRLCSSTVEQLREFLDTVNARDVTSDDAIKALSEQARVVLGNYSADDLKSSFTAKRVRSGLNAVKTQLDALIQREGGRKIDLDLQ